MDRIRMRTVMMTAMADPYPNSRKLNAFTHLRTLKI